ncbi:MAG: prolyl oligopeptidase family serine peptidase [Bryobacterales bacterium]|nr:prolyl oligopeptidase family serine peptidase [Bryobacterales bacterium]
MLMRCLPVIALLPLLCAQNSPPPQELEAMRESLRRLDREVTALRVARTDPALVADVDVYRKAAEWILRFPEEFFKPEYAGQTRQTIERGLARAKALRAGRAGWAQEKGRLVRGYVSRVDGSTQPYGLTIPASYDGRPMRLDVWLHGRGNERLEISFIHGHDSAEPVPRDQDYIQLDVFGRGNNAYRWAGETDVFEAIESVRRRYAVDPDRILVRGFSMGGAGAWHLGLHHPTLWAGVEAGAGFSESIEYARLKDLPPWQTRLLTIYDAYLYARNAFLTPIVGYGGEEDRQLQASVNVREQLAREGIRFETRGYATTTGDLRALFLVGPKMGHRFHPDSKAESERFLRAHLPRREPAHIRLVTYTERYGRAGWISVETLERQYERAEVEALRGPGGMRITTANVAALRVQGPAGRYTVDGREIEAPENPLFVKRENWQTAPALPALSKRPGLQGPIDDAFRDGFLVVRPTGATRNEPLRQWTAQTMSRFFGEFAKWMRGDVRQKTDLTVTSADMRRHHLALFGDATSNAVLRRVLPKLPVRWTREEIVIGRERFPAEGNVLSLIYPNPEQPDRYVVLNSGHSFGEAEFRGTNALLFPRIGDWAVIRASDGAVVESGFFDRYWQPSE